MNEKLQFHPEIEKTLETSGVNIGRVKDFELAHDVARGTNNLDRQDMLIRAEIAERAVNEKFRVFVSHSLVDDALGISQSSGHVATFLDDKKEIRVKPLQDEAKIVAQEYDVLQRTAQRARDSRVDN